MLMEILSRLTQLQRYRTNNYGSYKQAGCEASTLMDVIMQTCFRYLDILGDQNPIGSVSQYHVIIAANYHYADTQCS